MKAEVYSVQADLLGKAANNEAVMQQAQSTREAVTQLQDRLNEQYDQSFLITRSTRKNVVFPHNGYILENIFEKI